MKIVISGATGFIGQALVKALRARGDQVVALARSVEKAQQTLGPEVEIAGWQPGQPGDWMAAFNGADGVVNLAGAPVADPLKPWTEQEQALIRSSRVDSTRSVVEAIRQAEPRPRVLVNASAVGYYGSQGDAILTESSPAGNGFLAGVVKDWEAAARPAEESDVRLVLLRTGIVLGAEGGALPALAMPFRLFAGGTMGEPGQWVPWIHLEDEIGLILYALDRDALHGSINAGSPNPVTMDLFCRQIGQALHRPSWVPGYSTLLKLALPKRKDAFLASDRMVPEAALAAGYQFRYTDSGEALRAILG